MQNPTHNANRAANNRGQLPLVTVVIPCHNHEEYVVRAIKSVVAQDYPAKAIVVVDDGSSDQSLNAVVGMLDPKTVKKNESQGMMVGIIDGVAVNVLHNDTPTGPSAARNKAIKLAWEKAHLFCMLDADDTYLPGKISKSVMKFLENPNTIGLVYTDAVITNVNTGTSIEEFREPFGRQRLEQECIVSNTPMISKLAFEKCGLYDEGMRTAEDWDLWLRITDKFIAVHLPEHLHTYTVTGKNASDVVPQEVWQANWRKIHERIQARRQGQGNV
jgi:glycosyltransferase involved in cell wall biosynthesis